MSKLLIRPSALGPMLAVRLMDHLVIPTFVLDPDGFVIVWNKACERMTQIAGSDVMGTKDHWKAFYNEPRPCLADLILQGRYSEIAALYQGWNAGGLTDYGVSLETEVCLPRTAGLIHLALDTGPVYDETGGLVAVIQTMRDITKQKSAQKDLEVLAIQDGLTGLANRRQFDLRLQAAATACNQGDTELALIMIDVDHFKFYNDRYGHVEGDKCLQEVATAIRSAVRGSDVAARFGGEEFAVILPSAGPSAAEARAEQIRASVERCGIKHEGSPIFGCVTISVGVVSASGFTVNGTDMLTTADSALYRSKKKGRNCITYSDLQSASYELW